MTQAGDATSLQYVNLYIPNHSVLGAHHFDFVRVVVQLA